MLALARPLFCPLFSATRPALFSCFWGATLEIYHCRLLCYEEPWRIFFFQEDGVGLWMVSADVCGNGKRLRGNFSFVHVVIVYRQKSNV